MQIQINVYYIINVLFGKKLMHNLYKLLFFSRFRNVVLKEH